MKQYLESWKVATLMPMAQNILLKIEFFASLSQFPLIFSFSLFFNIYAPITSLLLLLPYPLYRFLESSSSSSASSLTAATHYGFYFALLAIIDFLERITLPYVLSYLPFYYAVKVAACAWLILPSYMGITILYGRVMEHVFVLLKAPEKAD